MQHPSLGLRIAQAGGHYPYLCERSRQEYLYDDVLPLHQTVLHVQNLPLAVLPKLWSVFVMVERFPQAPDLKPNHTKLSRLQARNATAALAGLERFGTPNDYGERFGYRFLSGSTNDVATLQRHSYVLNSPVKVRLPIRAFRCHIYSVTWSV